MANKVLEGEQKKKGFCRRLCSGVYYALKGPSITHSVLFGICGGLFYYGAYYGYRYLKISFFDTMHVSNESRRRFMEKQMLFYNDMGYNLSMKYIGKGVPTWGDLHRQNGNTPKEHQHETYVNTMTQLHLDFPFNHSMISIGFNFAKVHHGV